MKASTLYSNMAAYLRKHGFSCAEGRDGGPRCFIGARISVTSPRQHDTAYRLFYDGPLGEIVGDCAVDYSEYELLEAGWTKRDAIAALEIAADIAAAEGR